MPLTLNENAANVNVLITIVDNTLNPISDIAFDDSDLTISYMKDSDTDWTELTLVNGVLGSWVSQGFIAVPGSKGEYLLSLPAAAINPRKTTMLRVEYQTNRALRDVISFTGPPAYPANFALLQISSAGKVTMNPQALAFSIGVPDNPISMNTDIQVYIGETAREVTLTANQDIESLELKVIFETVDKIDIAIVEDIDLTKTGETVVFTLPSAVTAETGLVRWAVRNATDGTLYGQGEFSVVYAPLEDVP